MIKRIFYLPGGVSGGLWLTPSPIRRVTRWFSARSAIKSLAPLARCAALLISLFSSVALISPGLASAEFLDTQGGVLFHTDRRLVVLTVSDQSTSGFFVSLSAEPVEFQLYDPAALVESKDDNFFIRFDPSQNRYTELIRGATHYRIRGSITINLGPARISVDNNIPYLSIVAERGEQNKQPDIAGYVGLNRVIIGSGRAMAAVFEANQLNDLKGLVEPYDIKSGRLLFKDTPLAARSIGFELQPPEVPCLAANALVLSSSELDSLKKLTAAPAREEMTRNLIARHKQSPPLKGLMVLQRAKDPNAASVLFDYQNNKAKTLKLINKSAVQALCVLDDVRMS